MKEGKRSIWTILGFCFYIFTVALPLYVVSTKILSQYNPFWLIPVFLFVFVIGVVSYKKIPDSIFGRFIRKETLTIDLSNETPYEFDNPYGARQTLKEAHTLQ